MFRAFSRRSSAAELMDDKTIDFATFRDCLHDLAIVNVCTLAHRPTLRWLREAVQWCPSGRPVSVLDVGSGGGDTLRRIARWAARHHHAVQLAGIDLNPWSKQFADQVTPSALAIAFTTGDIFAADPAPVDLVINSLFTHHLSDEQVVCFLRWLDQHARNGWFINDLHRHPLAWFLIKYATRLLRFHFMVRHDGPLSVARAFTKADWLRLLAAANIPMEQVEIRWYFPFRYCIARRKP